MTGFPVLSFVNWCAAGTVTASTQDATYVAANLKTAQKRGFPAKTTVITESWWKVDLGSPQAIGLIQLIRANFVTVRVQANDTDSWGGALLYDSGVLTMKRNLFNWQIQHALTPTGLTARWLRLLVAAQTPDEAPLNVFRLGGLWAGAATICPSGFNVDIDHEVHLPYVDRKPPSGAWGQRAYLDNPYVVLRRRREARFTWETPYLSTDELATWALSIDYNVWTRRYFALYENLGNPNMCWIVQPDTDVLPWAVAQPGTAVASNDWSLTEVNA